MRVGVAGIFSMMPSILFGPLFGGLASGLMDLLGFMLRPSGAFIPLLTVVAAVGGAVRGGMWFVLRGRNPRVMRIIVGALAVILLAFGFCNWLMLRADGVNAMFYYFVGDGDVDTSGMFYISRWLITRTLVAADPGGMLATMVTTVTAGPMGAGAFGLLMVVLDLLISAKLSEGKYDYKSVMPLLLAMLIGSWLVSSINTVVLMYTAFPAWQLLPFVVVWLPRIIQTTITTTVYAYFIAVLLEICKKQPALRQLIG